MSRVSINETTLTAIGDAIRGKTGKSDLIAPGDMPAEITAIESGGGGGIEVEPIVLTGDCTSVCSGPIPNTYLQLFGYTITTKQIDDAPSMFKKSTLERIPFEINFNPTTSTEDMNSMFLDCANLKEVPVMNFVNPEDIGSLFSGCKMLRNLPENFGDDWTWTKLQTDNYAYHREVFKNCYSLRKIPSSFLQKCIYTSTSNYLRYSIYYSGFAYCYNLDELVGLPVQLGPQTSNIFSNTPFTNCGRLKNLIFDTNEDGSAKTTNWKNQIIPINVFGYSSSRSYITGYNSGITADKEVKDDATYQALKDDPDWFTCDINYCRYNHDSAVATINSLPDTSAYLAANGGTNTIKFFNAATMGSKTDGGATGNLTEEEIAVAAAKGWTVSLV